MTTSVIEMPEPHSVQSRIAAELRGARAKRNVPQARLQQKLGLSQSAVSRRLNGLTPLTVGELFAACDVLGVNAAQLVAEVWEARSDGTPPSIAPAGEPQPTVGNVGRWLRSIDGEGLTGEADVPLGGPVSVVAA